MKHRKSIRLLHKYLYGKPNLEEKARIDKWYSSIDEKQIETDEKPDLSLIREQLYLRILTGLESAGKIIPFYKRPVFKISAAASILIILAVTGWLLIDRQPVKDKTTEVQKQSTRDVLAPAINKAVITLADGRNIAIDSIAKGELATEGNTTVRKMDNGQIIYQASGKAVPQFNTLTVPKGSKPVNLVLPDGTEVWLNVASSITYPTSFTGIERTVQIKGEAYFDVATVLLNSGQKMPFKVMAGGIQTQVLGTQFNIQAYEDETSLQVTLLEGSVKVSSLANNQSLMLKPGQQAALAYTLGQMQLKTVQTDEVIAWKNGLFRFTSQKIPAIMRQIARWYDIEVVYEGTISEEEFSGIVKRNSNVSEVLKIMEQAGIKFRIEDKKVTVLF